MGWPDTQSFSHAWGPVRWPQLLAASQGIAAFSACCLPQISHMLLRLFERCEPDTSRPASATLTAILQHPAGVPLTLSAGCPIWAELIPIGARRRRWRRCRGTWRRRASASRWGRTGRVEDACARGTIGTGLVATSTAPWRWAWGSPWGWRLRGMRQERTNRSNESVLEGDPRLGKVLPQIRGCALLSTGTIPALDAWIGRWQVQRKRRIQPQHVDLHIIPERNRHDVAAVQRLAHGCCTPLFIVIVHITEHC